MNLFLNFSDAAKYADIAKNLYLGLGYHSNFNFWGYTMSDWVQPLTPYSILFFFKIFGVSDIAVIATSFFYFILSLFFVYLLTNKIYKDNVKSVVSTIAVGFNYNLINYATTGASESPFIFEIIAGLYFLSLKKWWANIIGILFAILMYLTRPQAIIYIIGLILFYFFNNYNLKKAITYSLSAVIIISFVYMFISKQGAIAVTQNLPGVAASDSLRGSVVDFNLSAIVKKVFYNLYNFYKSLPEIINPYFFATFIISLFIISKDKLQNNFKFVGFLMTILTFLVAALTIPMYRYLHPVVPIIYILAVTTLFDLFDKNKFRDIIVSSIVIFFCVGQTLGVILLDSRFNMRQHNINKTPIYIQMSYKLKDITNKDDVVVTNLDTWGSWYGDRKTIWFPLEPSMVLKDENNIKYIYLTSYKMDDENYYMDENWREIFIKPDTQKILSHYKFVSEYRFNAADNYEREDGRAVLLQIIK